MSADNAWYVGKDAAGRFYVFGGFESYVGEWDSEDDSHLYSEDEKRKYILRHSTVHCSFDNEIEARNYAFSLDDGTIDSYWNPKTAEMGLGTEYGVCSINLDFIVDPDKYSSFLERNIIFSHTEVENLISCINTGQLESALAILESKL